MNNGEFLEVIKQSFASYLDVQTSRSTAKLKILHGEIAKDLAARLGGGYKVKSQGIGNGKEGKIVGRYYDKNVDVTILKDDKPLAGVGIKFVMRNYLQNSNNYFESMLGETANIRSNRIAYFQIFIIFSKVPYFKSSGKFKKYDEINKHNLQKYFTLSKDDIDAFFHAPNKTLLVVVKLKDEGEKFENSSEFNAHYKSRINDANLIDYDDALLPDGLGGSVIFNDYEAFLDKIYHAILAI